MHYEVLGPVRVVGADGNVDLGPPKRRALLSLLLIHAGRSLSVDKVLDALWGLDLPEGGAKTLQVHVSKLRSSLRAGLGTGEQQPIETDSTGYRLNVDPQNVDANRLGDAFEAATTMAGSEPEGALARLDAALASVRGTPYDDVAHEDFALGEVRRLDELIVAAQELRIDCRLRLGRAAEVVPDLERIVADHPHRERSWEMLMLALYASGRQADALRAYSRAAQILGEELGIEPGPDLRRLEERILLEDPDLPAPVRQPIRLPERRSPDHEGNLPTPLTGFVGREAELEAVTRLLSSHRLVTLAGSGGTGKTRLAIEAARRVDEPDGNWLVRLGRLHDPAGIAALVCETLGLNPREDSSAFRTVVHDLRHRKMLLVIDNCEHLVEGAAEFVESLTSAAPGVTVLATSREPLQLSGEHVFRVKPMTMPAPGSGPAGLHASDAGSLFVDRAAEAGYRIADEEAEAAIGVACALEGVPLALELAAARLRSMSLAELQDRLSDRFALLVEHERTAEDHQRTLERAVEWSFDLLGPDEKVVFTRLSVFRGGWALDAAEAVVSGDEIRSRDVARILAQLVDKSLVTADRVTQSRTRYGMLETLRQFAETRLDRPDEVRARHLAYFVDLASTAGGQTSGRLIDRETANVRAAVTWAIERGHVVAVLQVVGALGSYFASRDRLLQPVRWVEAVEERLGEAPPDVAASALTAAGDLALIAGDTTTAARLHQAAAALAAAAGEGGEEVRALRGLGRAALEEGDRERAAERFETGRLLAERTGDRHLLADVMVDLAAVADRARQHELLMAAIEHHSSKRVLGGEATALLQLGWLHLGSLDLDAAEQAFARASELAVVAADPAMAAMAHVAVGDAAAVRGDATRVEEQYRLAHEAAATLESAHLRALTAGRLGDLAVRNHDLVAARAHLTESLSGWRSLPRQPGRAAALICLGSLDLAEGRLAVAERHLDDALELWARFNRRDGEAWAWSVRAAVTAARDDAAGAADLAHRAVEGYRELLGSGAILDPWMCPEAGEPLRVLAACRASAERSMPSALGDVEELEKACRGGGGSRLEGARLLLERLASVR